MMIGKVWMPSLNFLKYITDLAHNTLIQTVYDEKTDGNRVAAMWRYRSRVTIKHLGFFIEQKKSTLKCPILKEYLKQVITIIIVVK